MNFTFDFNKSNKWNSITAENVLIYFFCFIINFKILKGKKWQWIISLFYSYKIKLERI